MHFSLQADTSYRSFDSYFYLRLHHRASSSFIQASVSLQDISAPAIDGRTSSYCLMPNLRPCCRFRKSRLKYQGKMVPLLRVLVLCEIAACLSRTCKTGWAGLFFSHTCRAPARLKNALSPLSTPHEFKARTFHRLQFG